MRKREHIGGTLYALIDGPQLVLTDERVCARVRLDVEQYETLIAFARSWHERERDRAWDETRRALKGE